MPDRDDPVRLPPLAGRGAVRNVRGRYESSEVVPFDDGWGSLDEAPARIATETIPEKTRSIISKNDSPDIPFTYSINPYKGCEHGCSYCFARPTHAYLNLSPGLDFETKIVTKPDAPDVLRRTLGKKGYKPDPIAIGANTDPYQPVERKLRITRGILEVLCEFRHPFSIVTKSNLVLRDLDLIAPMAREGRAQVFVSITTLDRTLARRMEPRAPTPTRRVEALAGLHAEGVPTGVLASPMIPALNESELEAILEAGAAAGCASASYLVVRLPHELKELFVDWLETHYPTKAERVLAQLRAMRGGALYDSRYGRRMRGEGPFAELLQRRFEIACRRLKLNMQPSRRHLDCSAFAVPYAPGPQGRLFG